MKYHKNIWRGYCKESNTVSNFRDRIMCKYFTFAPLYTSELFAHQEQIVYSGHKYHTSLVNCKLNVVSMWSPHSINHGLENNLG